MCASNDIWTEYWQLNYSQLYLAGESLLKRNEALARQFHARLEPVPAWICASELEQAHALQAAQFLDERGNLLLQLRPGNSTFIGKQSRALLYPWDLLHAHEQAMQEWEQQFSAVSAAQVLTPEQLPPGVFASQAIHLGKGSRILPGVVMEGAVWIGENCRIGPHAYLRGPIAIGNECVVGHAVEIKNVLMQERSAVAHLSYVGDSILGKGVNFGAGSIVANFRHDGSSHRSLWRGEKLDTQRQKFGAIIGDEVRLGINTCIYPGRKLSKGTQTLPGEIVREDICS